MDAYRPSGSEAKGPFPLLSAERAAAWSHPSSDGTTSTHAPPRRRRARATRRCHRRLPAVDPGAHRAAPHHDTLGTEVQHSSRGGAGGNRTPVRQPLNEPATTIPVIETDAVSPAGRTIAPKSDQRPDFPGGQRSFSPSVVFPTVISRFCCRAAGDRPRAALLLTMSLHSPGIRRRE
jgi:hypothetical protein